MLSETPRKLPPLCYHLANRTERKRKTPSYERNVRCAEKTPKWPNYIFTLMPVALVKSQATLMHPKYLRKVLLLYKGGRKFSSSLINQLKTFC